MASHVSMQLIFAVQDPAHAAHHLEQVGVMWKRREEVVERCQKYSAEECRGYLYEDVIDVSLSNSKRPKGEIDTGRFGRFTFCAVKSKPYLIGTPKSSLPWLPYFTVMFLSHRIIEYHIIVLIPSFSLSLKTKVDFQVVFFIFALLAIGYWLLSTNTKCQRPWSLVKLSEQVTKPGKPLQTFANLWKIWNWLKVLLLAGAEEERAQGESARRPGGGTKHRHPRRGPGCDAAATRATVQPLGIL